MRVVAILASHNRRATTLSCLRSYFAQQVPADWDLQAVLLDAASADGTAAAVGAELPEVQVLAGSADTYWAGGMAEAERAALTRPLDALMWLNDDVVLDADGLVRLGEVAARGAIAVGALREPSTGAISYSGVRITGRHPLRVELVAPGGEERTVDTFNGNAVLIPKAAHDRVGEIDGTLGHAAADFDYGLRAARSAVPSVLCPGTVGTCARNPESRPWANRKLSRRRRLAALVGPKGLPPRPRARYLRRHGGVAWPIYWVAPYVRALPEALGRPR